MRPPICLSVSLSVTGMSVSPETQECPSVPQLWIVYQSGNSGSLSVPQIWNVRQSCDYGMSVSPATLDCSSVRRLQNVHQSHDSGMSVSPVSLECSSVLQLKNVKVRCINVPLTDPTCIPNIRVAVPISPLHFKFPSGNPNF